MMSQRDYLMRPGLCDLGVPEMIKGRNDAFEVYALGLFETIVDVLEPGSKGVFNNG